MRKTARLAIAMMILCGAALSAAEKPAQIKPITGQVVNAKGKAVAGAKVYLFRFQAALSDGPTATMTADKNGRFSYRPKPGGEPSGSRTFAAWAPGHACTGDEVMGGSAPIKIVLQPESSFKGKVVDEKGKALAGVTVGVVGHFSMDGDTVCYLPGPIPGHMTAKTAKDGSFVIKGIPDPSSSRQFSAYVKVTAKGRAGSISGVSGDEMAGAVTVVAPPACVLEGTLSMAPGLGSVPKDTKLEVMARSDKAGYMRQFGVGADGRFKLTDLPPGKATVTLVYTPRRGAMPLVPPSWVLAKAGEPELKSSQPAKLDLVMCKGAVLKGVVKEKGTGNPVPKCSISFAPKDEPKYVRQWSAVTDDQGRFEWRVSPGTVKVSLTSANSRFLGGSGPTVELTLADGDVKTDVTLEYDPEAITEYTPGPKPVPADFELKPGEYELKWDPDIDCSSAVYGDAPKVGSNVAPLVKKSPALKSGNAYRAAFEFDGTGEADLLVVILDESKGTGKGFDLAYIDANRNRDLTDDKPVSLRVRSQSGYLTTDHVTVQARQGKDGGATSNPVQVSVRAWIVGKSIRWCNLDRKGAWKGAIESGKGKVECAVVDVNSDGIYGAPAAWDAEDGGLSRGDALFVDASGAGHVSADYWSGHKFDLYRVTRIGSKFYSVTINETGNRVKIEPYSGPMGKLSVRGTDINGARAEADSISVYGAQGAYEFQGVKGEAVSVPAGEYRANDCQLNVISKDGRKLAINCTCDKPVLVTADGSAAIDISGKISARLNPGDKELGWKPGATASLEWVIKISDKTTISQVGRSSSAYKPTVKFIDAKGRVVAETKGEYG
jgi:hypothetical protein